MTCREVCLFSMTSCQSWLIPFCCRCSGTTKWVHQACIQRWVDEKQKGNLSAQVNCPQCGVAYRISYPSRGVMVITLDSVEKLTQRISPILFGGLCVGSLYWSCITFGAVTLMQTVGQEKGQVIIERADPLFLIVSLPLVPVGLVLSRMIRWEEPVRDLSLIKLLFEAPSKNDVLGGGGLPKADTCWNRG